jgi:tRNA-dihydrouridine synthase A
MEKPGLVAECLAAMRKVTDIPVTVKSRIGIDEHDSYDFLVAFVEPLVDAGCRKFIVHARIAILEGLSPKENRSVPPLDYGRVYRLKRDFPDLEIVLNGGIETIVQADAVLENVDGVMIGRQAYHQPYLLAELETHLNPGWSQPKRSEVVEQMIPYVERELAAGARLSSITRHMLGLFAGQPGARAWRRYLSEHAHRDGAGSEILVNALNAMPAAPPTDTMQGQAIDRAST